MSETETAPTSEPIVDFRKSRAPDALGTLVLSREVLAVLAGHNISTAAEILGPAISIDSEEPGKDEPLAEVVRIEDYRKQKVEAAHEPFEPSDNDLRAVEEDEPDDEKDLTSTDVDAESIGINPYLLTAEELLDDIEKLQAAEGDEELVVVDPKSHKRTDLPGLAPNRQTSSDSLTLFMNDAGKYPLLNAGQEVMLAKRIERGDRSAKALMINSNLRLVLSIAKRYQGHGLPLADLVQEGVIGLNRATEKFDWRRGFKFSTYATWWIRQACQRGVANQSATIRIPAHIHERQVTLARAAQKIEAAMGREATIEELHQATKIKPNHIEEALGTVEASVSLQQNVGEYEEAELGDLLADESTIDPVEEADRALKNQRLHAALDHLPEQKRRILELRFGLNGPPRSLEFIGKELGLTRERIRQLETQSLEHVKKIMRYSSLPLASVDSTDEVLDLT